MRILVTGGAGFIGSNLVDRLVAGGHEVVVLDNLLSGKKENLPSHVRLIQADVRSEEASTEVKALAPEIIFHEAAQMDVRLSVKDPSFDADVNLVGLLRLLEAGRAGGKLQHVLFASSGGAMYGEQSEFPAKETHPTRPESPYGLSKAVSEQYLDWYRRMYKLTSTSLRYSNVYGPRQSPHGEAGVVAIFCQRILDGKPLTIYGDGLQTRDYVFVEDVVEANARAFEKRLDGGFNVGVGIETTVVDIAQMLLRISGKQVPIHHEAARPGEQRRSVIDPSLLEKATGFRPKTPLEQGLTKTFEFFARRHKS